MMLVRDRKAPESFTDLFVQKLSVWLMTKNITQLKNMFSSVTSCVPNILDGIGLIKCPDYPQSFPQSFVLSGHVFVRSRTLNKNNVVKTLNNNWQTIDNKLSNN